MELRDLRDVVGPESFFWGPKEIARVVVVFGTSSTAHRFDVQRAYFDIEKNEFVVMIDD